MLMNTTTLHVTLSESLENFVKQQVEKEQYSNPSDFIRVLIREEQKRQDEKRLEQMLLEGLASGSRTISPQDWQELKGKVLDSVRK